MRTFLSIRELGGLDAESASAVRLCARMAQRITLDELVDLCEAGVDGPDRELLCEAVIWLDVLIAEPNAWPVSVALAGWPRATHVFITLTASRACSGCGYLPSEPGLRVVGECVPNYHTVELVGGAS